MVKTVKQGSGTVIQMRDLTPFEWDRMHVIQPYTPPEAINRKLGFEWAGANRSNIEMFDTIRLLVFTKGKEVVADLDYNVRDGFFDDGGRHEYSVEEARFIVEEEGEDEKVLIIRWLPERGALHKDDSYLTALQLQYMAADENQNNTEKDIRMQLQAAYPIVVTSELAECRDFYVRQLGSK
ncbi:MAG: hypothetical protein H0U18_02015 [Pyrinomonadaceae bacterium]|nr:hypothetical protein [Pyrinomonadaceae bacterium]